MTVGDDNERKTSRRGLVMAAAAGGCTIAVLAGAPAILLVTAPLSDRSGGAKWVRTLRAEGLKEGVPTRVAVIADRVDAWTREQNVDLGSVWLVRRGDKVIAFSAVCPHLGCSVNAVEKGFSCPCHTSAFDAEGKRTSGPSPRDLDTLATRIEEGFVAVDFRRFRIGIPEKVEA